MTPFCAATYTQTAIKSSLVFSKKNKKKQDNYDNKIKIGYNKKKSIQKKTLISMERILTIVDFARTQPMTVYSRIYLVYYNIFSLLLSLLLR